MMKQEVMMKKKIGILSLILILVTVGGVSVTMIHQAGQQRNDKKMTIVTSFYPMYIVALNLTDGMDNVEVVNLTENAGGCLHDYQLTTNDMKTLEHADIFITNGGGMESFTEDVIKGYPDLKVVDSSVGIELLENMAEHNHEEEGDISDSSHEEELEHSHEEEMEDSHNEEAEHTNEEVEHTHKEEIEHTHKEELEHSHEEETEHTHEGEHNHGIYNAHIWLSPTLYLEQIENIKNALCEWDKENASQYTENAKIYEEKINVLREEIRTQISNPKNTQAIIFHDSFAYLAKELGIEVVYAIDMDNDTSLGAGQVAQIVDEVKLHQIKLLFTEEQFKNMIAKSVSEETGADVYVIDSLVTGEMNKDAYINGMENNIKVLKEALYK